MQRSSVMVKIEGGGEEKDLFVKDEVGDGNGRNACHLVRLTNLTTCRVVTL